jgi:hypothetical protein
MAMVRKRRLVLVTAALSVTAAMTAVTSAGAADSQIAATRCPVHAIWCPPLGPAPGTATSESPALAPVGFPRQSGQDTLLLWTGLAIVHGGHQISYEYATSTGIRVNRWSRVAAVDGGAALTNTRPSAARLWNGQVIVTWQGAGSARHVWYSVGTPLRDGRLSWGPQLLIPGAQTSLGPTVYGPPRSHLVFVAWRTAGISGGSDVHYAIGTVNGAGDIRWVHEAPVPGAQATSAPAVAQAAETRNGGTGRLYVFWQAGRGRIGYSDTAAPVGSESAWRGPAYIGNAGSRTGAAPAVQPIGSGGQYPLVIIYPAGSSTVLLYVYLNVDGRATSPHGVPGLRSIRGPAFLGYVLAATSKPRRNVVISFGHICGGC